jgi:hypothetical protein
LGAPQIFDEATYKRIEALRTPVPTHSSPGFFDIIIWGRNLILTFFAILMLGTPISYLMIVLFIPFTIVLAYIIAPHIYRFTKILTDFFSAIFPNPIVGTFVAIVTLIAMFSLLIALFFYIPPKEVLMEAGAVPCIPLVELGKGYVKETCPLLVKWSDIDNVTISNPAECPLGRYKLVAEMWNNLQFKEVGKTWVEINMTPGEHKTYTLRATISRLVNCGKNNTYKVKVTNLDLKTVVAEVNGTLEVI